MDAPDHSAIDETFGARFLDARRSKGLSQEAVVTALAERGIKLHVTAIGKIERGERRVSIGEASALAHALGYTVDSLIGGGGDLVTSYQMLDYTSRLFSRAADDYLQAMVNVAVTADSAHDLRDADRVWLLKEMPQQTPARLIEGRLRIDARLSRDGITEQGPALAALRDAIYRDDDALEAGHG